MKNTIFDTLENLLKSKSKYCTPDNNLLKNQVLEDAQKMDAELLEILLSNNILKEVFFTKVKDIYVFDKIKFNWILNNKSFLPDSYTRFQNKIGFCYSNGIYLSTSNDIELVFPYKDCYLEGGQTKEDQKKNEVFYNELLAPDQISNLLAPKAFCNAKKYDKNGITEITEINKNDNLIIKGNNLLALSSLLEKYEGEIKLIYIDPPFNTGKDAFKYNDRFNHSSWLVFMKNRLEIARKLLKNNGIFVVHVGNEEASYIQVLLDEVFKRENYLNHITMTTNAPSGFKATSGKIFSTANHIFIYAKNASLVELNKQYIKKDYDSAYKYILKNPDDDYSKWEFETFFEIVAKENGFKTYKEMKKNTDEKELEMKLLKFMDIHKNTVFRTAAISGGALEKRKETVKKSKENRNKVLKHPNDDIENFYIVNGEMIVFWENTYKNIDGKMQPAMALTDVWTDVGFTGIANEGEVTLKNGKKPEKLLKRIIDLATSENDIVLDYHLGSGTTAAVAHKMNRHYIGIEQLDYEENDSVIRLQNVINGDTTGISKIVNWQGGGSFIYCELAKLNQKYIDMIENCKTDGEITDIIKTISESDYVSTKVNPKDINTEIKEYKELSFDEKKRFAMELLDKNQLYVNKSERNDPNMNLSEKDIAFTNSFYGEQK